MFTVHREEHSMPGKMIEVRLTGPQLLALGAAAVYADASLGLPVEGTDKVKGMAIILLERSGMGTEGLGTLGIALIDRARREGA
jgi:hypothetical protein